MVYLDQNTLYKLELAFLVLTGWREMSSAVNLAPVAQVRPRTATSVLLAPVEPVSGGSCVPPHSLHHYTVSQLCACMRSTPYCKRKAHSSATQQFQTLIGGI